MIKDRPNARAYVSSQPNPQIKGWQIAVAAIVFGSLGYAGFKYWSIANDYDRGQQAYKQGNCSNAIAAFDRVINGQQLHDFSQHLPRARTYKQECQTFLAASQQQKSGKLAAALDAYNNFIKTYPNSALTPTAQQQTIAILKEFRLKDYNQGDKAYKQGNCSSAIAAFDRVINGKPLPDLNEYVDRARSQKKECQDFLAASKQQKGEKLAAALDAYSNFIDRYPSSALAAKVRQQTAVIFDRYQVEEIAQKPVCSQLNSLFDRQLIPQLETNKPLLFWHCGRNYERLNEYDRALEMYERFLQEFPNHKLASTVNAAKARSIIARAAPNAGKLPPPIQAGKTISGSTEVLVKNNSPEPIRLTFSGPEPRFEELPACANCTKHSTPPLGCPGDGPSATYQIKPGEYQVLVESIGNSAVIPFRGQWSLQSGGKYDNCFFIVTQQRL